MNGCALVVEYRRSDPWRGVWRLPEWLCGHPLEDFARHQIERRFDELCSAAVEIADLAADYWQGTAQDLGISLREAKIIAHLRKIAGLRVLLANYISASAMEELQLTETAFFREVSGGQFGVHNRTAESQRIIGCQSVAAELMLTARRARLRDLEGLWRRR